ncbi:MAG: hypothetical protein M3Y74_14975 [Chloroflexota bacterium]|nr:hypothetical protein [Chloroflexota bacterium]
MRPIVQGTLYDIRTITKRTGSQQRTREAVSRRARWSKPVPLCRRLRSLPHQVAYSLTAACALPRRLDGTRGVSQRSRDQAHVARPGARCQD